MGHPAILLLLLAVSVYHFLAVIQLDPNTKRFKQRLIYFNTDTQHSMHIFREILFIKPQNDT